MQVNSPAVVLVVSTILLTISGCAGLGSPGLFGASSFNALVDSETAWRAFEAVLKEDPTLFEVKSVRRPAGGEDGLVKGSKGGRDVAVWVQPQGKDNTTIAVQVLLGPWPDTTAQHNLAQALADQMRKKLP